MGCVGVGAGGAIYSPLMPNMTENSLNSFSCTVSLEAVSSTFITELYGIRYALKLKASVSRGITIQIYTQQNQSKSQDSNQARIFFHRFTVHYGSFKVTAA